MKILVTGGAGFGGAGLVTSLLEKGHNVTVLDITAPSEADKLALVIDDLRLRYLWKAVHDMQREDVVGHDCVVHIQAQADVPMGFPSPYWTTHQNVMGTIAVLEACRDTGIKKLIYAGSGNELGRAIYLPIDEEHPLTPHNPYAFSKAAAELACWAWYRCYKVPVVIMSNGIVTGPGMRREIFIFKWLWAIAHGKSIVLEGGDQTRDITYSKDVMGAWLAAIEADAGMVVGEKFQVSYGEERSVSDIAKMCFQVMNKPVDFVRRPYRPGEEGQRECFTNAKARSILGYDPKVPPLEAIRLTWEWMRTMLEETVPQR